MSRKISAPRQRNAVSQGIALGFCVLGRYEFTFDKLRIDLAFEHAWRDWPDRYKLQFPQVSTDLRNGTDAVWVMTRASERTHSFALFWDWESPGPITIYARQQDWDTDDPDDLDFALKVIDGDVPLDGWVTLAQAFLVEFDRQHGKS